jgi:hypothetical protein
MRPVKYIEEFNKAEQPVVEAITKFGGLPNWLGEPCFPVNGKTKNSISFLCQIEIDNEIFKDIEADMAYIFFDTGVDIDWDNWAVILQSKSGKTWESYQPDIKRGHTLMQSSAIVRDEYTVKLRLSADETWVSKSERENWTFEQFEEYRSRFYFTKVGGTDALPTYLAAHVDSEEEGYLLLQIDFAPEATFPFEIDGVDEATFFWFYLSKDGHRVDFLMAESDY